MRILDSHRLHTEVKDLIDRPIRWNRRVSSDRTASEDGMMKWRKSYKNGLRAQTVIYYGSLLVQMNWK
jgi:hypothetical protein